jgi:hypothetical protein
VIDTVTIPAVYNGPPGAANGGYACGLVAEAIGTSATVRLIAPSPLDTPLTRRRSADGAVRLLHDGIAVAEGRPGRPADPPPPAPPLDEALRASRSFDAAGHPFPSCFGCGPDRRHDGLRVFPGRTSDGRLAGPWLPGAFLARGAFVDPLFVWAALDCASGLALLRPGVTAVMATMTAALEAPVNPGRAYVVTSWSLGGQGRKHRAGSALHTPGGRLLAHAETLWITI